MTLWEVRKSGNDGIAIIAAGTADQAIMVALKARSPWMIEENLAEEAKWYEAKELIMPTEPARITYYYE